MRTNLDILRDYIHRMFLKKAAFVEYIESNYDTKLPKPSAHNYKELIEATASLLGEEKLLDALGLSEEGDAYRKIDLIHIFVQISRSKLYEIAAATGLETTYQMNRGDLTRCVLFNIRLDQLRSLFAQVANKSFIVVIDEYGSILGPNWISRLPTDEDVDAAKDLISFMDYIENPVACKIGRQLGLKVDSKADLTQQVLTRIGPSRFFSNLTNVIRDGIIAAEDLRGSYVWSIDVHQKYGIRYTSQTPVENLCDFLCSNILEKDFSPYLKHGDWPYRDRILAYCIENDPYLTVDENIGSPKLRRWLEEELGISKLPTEKRELVNLLLFQLGFPVPERPTGIHHFTDFLLNNIQVMKKRLDVNLMRGIGASVFVEAEKVLKDIIYFYSAYLSNAGHNRGLFGDWETKQVAEEIKSLYPGLKDSGKPLARATFGELVGVLGSLSKKSQSNPEALQIFGRDTVIPKDGRIMMLLNEICPYRKFFVHDVEGPSEPVSQKKLQGVLQLMINLADEMREICPVPIKAFRLVTSTFRTTYLVAKDEKDTEYTMYLDEYISEEIFKHIYLMKKVSSYIVINPTLVRRP